MNSSYCAAWPGLTKAFQFRGVIPKSMTVTSAKAECEGRPGAVAVRVTREVNEFGGYSGMSAATDTATVTDSGPPLSMMLLPGDREQAVR